MTQTVLGILLAVAGVVVIAFNPVLARRLKRDGGERVQTNIRVGGNYVFGAVFILLGILIATRRA